jgi:BirA family biotin operon repressor/biotin-[acetyl-CoA-carboxylase] ligase
MPTTDPLDVAELERLLGPATMWRPIHWKASTGSTNDDLAAMARGGQSSGTVLFSEHQGSGKARFDRVWRDTPGTSLATSVLVSPRPVPLAWGWLSLLVGIAVREGVERYTQAESGRLTLKWPNDVLLDGHKICGILSERVGDRAVLGFGLNVSMATDELPVPTATSLMLAGLPHDKAPLMAEVLTSLERWFGLWQQRGEIRDEFLGECATIGRRVRVHLDVEQDSEAPGRGADVTTGVAVGVDEHGALIVDGDDGLRRVLAAGDVVHLR